MRRFATISVLAALLSGLPLINEAAAEGYRNGRPYFFGPAYYGPPYGYAAPHNSYAFWRSYYRAQADLSLARRNFRANYFVAHGYNPPSRVLGPPTNYYAERYTLDPYSYFVCPLARRGEGVCSATPDLSAVPTP
jgi:hypothetical protein